MKNLYFFLLVVCLICISCTETNTRYPRVITSILIAQSELYGNGQEGITKQNLVIRTQEEWDDLLNAMNSVNNVSNSFAETEIDFNSFMVIAVFDEVRGNSGCSINISNIIEYIDKIVVDVHIVTTTSGADVMNQPYYIVKIPVIYNNIVFDSNMSNDTNNTLLVNTNWKLIGIVDTETDSFTVLEPQGCIRCYTLMFESDSTLSGRGYSNSLNGRCEIDYVTNNIHVLIGTATLVYDNYDEELYIETLNSVYYFSLQENQLLLYFDNHTYLIFNLLEL